MLLNWSDVNDKVNLIFFYFTFVYLGLGQGLRAVEIKEEAETKFI